MSKRNLVILSIILVTITLLVSGVWYALDANILPCTAAWAQPLIAALALAWLVQIFLAPRLAPRHSRAILVGHVVLLFLIRWLGLFPLSPLGYASGQIPNLRGFLIIRQSRRAIVENNEVLSLQTGSVAAIQPLLLDETSHCRWISAEGAVMDGMNSCDMVYIPPPADHDVLRLQIRSSCGLPDSAGRIRIAILP